MAYDLSNIYSTLTDNNGSCIITIKLYYNISNSVHWMICVIIQDNAQTLYYTEGDFDNLYLENVNDSLYLHLSFIVDYLRVTSLS